MLAILSDDAGFIDRGNAVFAAVQGHIAAAERRVQGAGDNYALTADGEVRRQFFT
ncbi:hypothetical protein D3C84_1316830 [compost metagenome]